MNVPWRILMAFAALTVAVGVANLALDGAITGLVAVFDVALLALLVVHAAGGWR